MIEQAQVGDVIKVIQKGYYDYDGIVTEVESDGYVYTTKRGAGFSNRLNRPQYEIVSRATKRPKQKETTHRTLTKNDLLNLITISKLKSSTSKEEILKELMKDLEL